MIKRIQSWLPVRVFSAFGASQAANYASALAFNALLSMFPLMLGVLAIIGLSIRDPATELRFQSFIIQAFPGTAQPELLSAIKGVKQAAGVFGLVSIGGLIWSATGIFSTMEFAFAQILGINQRDFVRQKLMGIVMMILLVIAIGVTIAANALAGLVPYAWVTSFVVGATVMIALLTLLYRFVPNRAFRLRDVIPGALLAGLLIEILSLAFPLYQRFAGGFNTYGAQFALFFLLAAWFYLLSNLILLGAVFNKFRLGEPVHRGLIASPSRETRELRRPDEVIAEHKQMAEGEDAAQVQQPERPSPGRLLVGYVLVGLVILKRLFRRRGSHTIET